MEFKYNILDIITAVITILIAIVGSMSGIVLLVLTVCYNMGKLG